MKLCRLFFLSAIAVIILAKLALCHAEGIPWKHVAQFTGKKINCVYFMDDEGKPDWGVLGAFDTITHKSSLYYSRDLGLTWTEAQYPPHNKSFQFSFKDSLNGWVGVNNDTAYTPILVTNDGGKSWAVIMIPPMYRASVGSGIGNFICYNKGNGYLFRTSNAGGNCFFSTDLAKTWGYMYSDDVNMSSFSNDTDGMLAPSVLPTLAYTNDGGLDGLSWIDNTQVISDVTIRTFYALPIKNTRTFFAIGLHGTSKDTSTWRYGLIIRTDNAGKLFYVVDTLFQSVRPVDYIQGDLKRLYVETDHGVFLSRDEAKTWRSIDGPNRVDTGEAMELNPNLGSPLYVHLNHIFAADDTGGLWYLDASIFDGVKIGDNQKNDYGIYPNPVKISATITAMIPSSVTEHVSIELYDILGRKIESIEPVEQGMQEIQIKAPRTPGVYYLSLRSGSNLKYLKINVIE